MNLLSRRVDRLALVFFTLLGAFCGWRGIPITLETLASRLTRAQSDYILPSSVDCRPTSIRLTASSDVLQTVWILNAYLENWRGDLVVSVHGWNGGGSCPETPSPTWYVDPPTALMVQPHFPNYAEFYPQTAARISRVYTITVTFKLSDGDVLTQTKTLHIPPRRSLHDAMARKILAGRSTTERRSQNRKVK